MTPGEKVKARREELGLTIEELSDKTGMPVRTLKMIEKGTRALYTDDLNVLIPALETKDGYFLDVDDEDDSVREQERYEELNRAARERMRARREELGLTIEELSERSGISVRRLKMIENGTREMMLRDLIALVPALETTAEYIWEWLKDLPGYDK